MRIEALVLGLLLAFAGTAAAQSAPSASISLALGDIEPPENITAGEEVNFTANVTFSASNVGCLEALDILGNATANVSVPEDVTAPDGIPEEAVPAPLTYTVPGQDIQIGDPVGEDYSENESIKLNITTIGGTTEDYQLNVTLAAYTNATSSMSCVPNEFPAAHTGNTNFLLNITADEDPDTDGDGVTDPNDDCPNQAGSTTNNGCPEQDDSTGGGGGGAGGTDGGDGAGDDGGDGTDGQDGDGTDQNQTPSDDEEPTNDTGNETGDENGAPIPWQLAPLAGVIGALAYRRKP